MPIFLTFFWLLSTSLEFIYFFITSNKNCFKLHVQDQRDVYSSLLRLFSFTQMSKMFTFVTIVTRKKLIMLVVHLVYSHYPGLDSRTSRLSGCIWDSENSYQYLCRIRCQAALSYNENIQLYLLGLLCLSSLLQANYLATAGTCIYSNMGCRPECAAGVIQKLLWWKVVLNCDWVSPRNFSFTGTLWTSAAAVLQNKE